MEFTTEDKLSFAEFFNDEGDAYTAALRISDDAGTASQIAVEWPRDPIVVREVERLRSESGDVTKIATKYDLVKFYWELANDPDIDPKDRISAAEHFGAVAGIYDPKANNMVNNTNVVTPTVMRVVDHGDADDWEQKLAKQQEELRAQANAKLDD